MQDPDMEDGTRGEPTVILIICDKCGKKTNAEEAHRRVDLHAHAFNNDGESFDFDKHYDFCGTCWEDLKTANPLGLWIEAETDKPGRSEEEKIEKFTQIILTAANRDAIQTMMQQLCEFMKDANKHDPGHKPRRTPQQLDDFAEMVRKA